MTIKSREAVCMFEMSREVNKKSGYSGMTKNEEIRADTEKE